MKKIAYAFLFCSLAIGVVSCSNGEYKVDPASNANAAVNPVTPLTSSEFNWAGDEPMSADINGVHWKADHAYFTLDTSGANVLIGTKDFSAQTLQFHLLDVWTNNLYPMEWNDYKRYAVCSDSVGGTYQSFFSYLSNSGGLKIIQNDSAVIKGMFYFKGISPTGKIVTVNKGYFKINK